MKFAQCSVALILFCAALCVPSSSNAAAARIDISPVGEVETIAIRRRDARQQLIVTAKD